MKRFYKLVSTQAQSGGGYAIHLDGRPVKTPGKALLLAPTQAIANAIMQEWAAQESEIVPDSMPLTQILSTRIDRVGHMRAEMQDNVLAYLDTDLVCYRTEQPPELAARQAALWDVWIYWFEDNFGTLLQTTTGLSALRHPAAAHQAVASFVRGLDDDRFTVLQLVTALSGSIILALAFVKNAIGPDALFTACHVEEMFKAALYNEDFYGPDPMQDKKQKAIRRDLFAAHSYLQGLREE